MFDWNKLQTTIVVKEPLNERLGIKNELCTINNKKADRMYKKISSYSNASSPPVYEGFDKY